MNLLRRILMLSVSSLPYALHAQASDLSMTSDLFAMFPPTLTAKEAQEKWETTYNTKCVTESETLVTCKTKASKELPQVVLSLNPKERNIEMLSVQLADTPLAKMNPNEVIKKLPLEKEKPISEKEEAGTQVKAKTLLGWYKLPQDKENRIQSISRTHDRAGIGYSPEYSIRCDKKEMKRKVANFQVETRCQGNSTIDLIVRFEDKNTPSVIDFDYQSSKIVEAIRQIAPSTEHPDVWLKAVAAFQEMVGDESRKPAWFNGEYIDYQFFPFGSFYFKTKHEGTKHTIEASWMEP